MFSILLAVLVVAATQNSTRVLNLARQVHDATGSEGDQQFSYNRACEPDGSATGRVGPAPPFTIAIRRLDRAVYSPGAQLLADVVVTNDGPHPLVFPWVRANEFGDGFRGADAMQVGIGFDMIDVTGREQHLTGTVLRGSPNRPGTMEAIAPGESITIRLALWTGIVDSPDAPRTGDAQLFAKLNFTSGNCHTWAPVRSPTVPIKFKGPDL